MAAVSTVIAIQCEEKGGRASILASDDRGLITDVSWHCSRTWQDRWQQPDFTDNPDIWVNAEAEYGTNRNAPWGLIRGINFDAWWIWYGSSNGDPATVYCRKDL